MLLLVEDPEFLAELFSRWSYLAPFVVLLLCGIGLPLPEEVTLIGSGMLVSQGEVDFVAITLVCSAAILLGDSIPYWLGRHYGLSVLRISWVSKILHPERFAILERRFESHGNWAIFTCRFFPGLRIPGYFTAGTLRMSYLRFLVLDGLGVLISVPTSIYVGKLFGESIDELPNLNLLLAFGIVTILLIGYVRARIRKRYRRLEVATGEAAEATADLLQRAEAGEVGRGTQPIPEHSEPGRH